MTTTYTVKVIIYGLLGFVPTYSADPAKPDSLVVLMPEIGHHRAASDGCGQPEHVSALIVRAESCLDNNEQCEVCHRCTGFPAIEKEFIVNGLWSLRGLSATIYKHHGDADLPDLGSLSPQGPEDRTLPKDLSDARDLAWIPRIKGAADTIMQQCLSSSGEEDRYCPLAGRFEIKGGRVSSCGLYPNEIKDDQGSRFELCPYLFRPLLFPGQKPVLHQGMAGGVLVEFEIPRTQSLEIYFHDIGLQGRAKRKVELKPEQADSVTIWVVNIPSGSHQGNHGCGGYEVDRHFEVLYDLAALLGDDRKLSFDKRPVPHKDKAACLFGEDARKYVNPSCEYVDLRDYAGAPPDRAACGNKFFAPVMVKQ